MTSRTLPHYVRTYRKRSGLSQHEMAFLLGVQTGAIVCRYERFVRQPSLRTALACAVIFRTPASELFRGLFEKVEAEVAARAEQLSRRCAEGNPTGLTARKLEALRAMTQHAVSRAPQRA